uniref:Uncharacterized protein n=1 Tax=Picea glauca TaxID=3330 RepID=A0A101LYA4_PICGL|nr:hypothetical protein ABT39_MTgene5780 [Picea glauca]
MLKLILGSRQNETNRLLPNYPTDNAFHQSPFAKVTRPEKRNGLERTEVMEQSFHEGRNEVRNQSCSWGTGRNQI